MQAMQGDWLPARAALHATGLYFSLREIRPSELQDPFMQETIARIPARESVVHVAREDLGKGSAGTSPAGIIFHVSRCGSTLVSQLLKQHVGAVVYAVAGWLLRVTTVSEVRELIREEVAQTVSKPAEVDDEIRALFEALHNPA